MSQNLACLDAKLTIHLFTNKNCWSSHQDQKNIQTGKRPNREIFDRQIPDRQISDRQISDRPLSPTGGVNPTRVSPLSWDRRLSCYPGLDMCCSLYLTLDQQVVFSVARITGVANLPLRMWSISKKHQLLLTWAPGPGVEPRSRGHKADALPPSYSHIPTSLLDVWIAGNWSERWRDVSEFSLWI